MQHDLPPNNLPIAFIGFGEAAQAFCESWGAARPAVIHAYDRKTDAPETAIAKRNDYAAHRVHGCENMGAALDGVLSILSVVTADQALAAARFAAQALAPGAYYYDMNSVAPYTKRTAAAVIGQAGGQYVDVAVMAPVRTALNRVPLLVSGPTAGAGAAVLQSLGFRPEVVSDEIGAASAIKMIRSIMIKGMEALTAECLLSARAAGVDEAVLASLDASFPGWDWVTRADYNLDRMLVHGTRRAAEMREAAATAQALGQQGSMAHATAGWQGRLGALQISPLPTGLAAKADAILAATGPQP
jgi:3-hydroxyisobutyrate dehydrogenase-like beta-hydroxyacid dehydrogenase